MENLSNEDVKIQSYIDAILSTDEIVDKRIFLVRHGESEEETKKGFDVNKSRDANSGLTKTGAKQMAEVAKYLLDILKNPEERLVLEDNAKGSARIKDSLDIIKSIVGYQNEYDDPKLDTLPPYGEETQMRAKLMGGDIHAQYDKELRERLKHKYKDQIKYILLTAHKSAISDLEHLFIDTKMEYATTYKYKHGEVRERDYNTQDRFINKYERKDILQINRGNYEHIIGTIEDEEIFKAELNNLKTDVNELDIIQLQNFINACFRKHPELYEKYLCSGNEDMRVFCLSNLLIECGEVNKTDDQSIHDGYIDRLDFIYKLYESSSETPSIEEMKILLKNWGDAKRDLQQMIEKLIIRLFIKQPRGGEIRELFESCGLSDFYEELQVRKKIYGKAVEIEKRSLDRSIKNQEKKAVIQRQIYRTEKIEKKENGGKDKKEDKEKGKEKGRKKKKEEKNEQEKEIDENRFRRIEIDEQELITGLKEGKHYIFPTHVGNGKSIWSCEFIKKSIVNPEMQIEFLEGKDFDMMGEEKCTNLLHIWSGRKGKFVLYIDGIDEINNTTIKHMIKNSIISAPYGIIVTSRLSEYNDKENPGCITLNMGDINKGEFIKNKILDTEKSKMILEKVDKSNLSTEIEGNPLLLNFICILAHEGLTHREAGVQKLEDIHNKADLYENISKLILYKHEGSKSGYYSGENGQKRLKNDMQLLGNFAYILQGNKDIKDFGNNTPLRDEDNFKRFSILFKKTENGNYGFIHKSFEEFFLARYLANENKGNEEIYKERDIVAGEEKRNLRKDFRPIVEFYGEILYNNEQTEKLEEFLGLTGLLENDDAFGYNFSLCLKLISIGDSGSKTINILIDRIKKDYQTMIDKRGDNETIIRFLFSRNLLEDKKLNRVSDILYNKIKKIHGDEIIYERFAELDNIRAINDLCQYAKKIKGEDKYNNYGENREGEIYTRLIRLNSREVNKHAHLWIKKMAKEKKRHYAGYISAILAKSNHDNDMIEYAFEYAKKIFKKKQEYYNAGGIYMILAEIDNAKAIEYAHLGANMLYEKGEYDEVINIYKKLAESSNEKAIEYALQGANTFIENGQIEEYDEVIDIYRKLGKSSNEKAIEYALQGADNFIENEENEEGLEIYTYLAQKNNEKAIERMANYASTLIKEHKYVLAGKIYKELGKSSNKKAIGYALEGASLLISDKGYTEEEYMERKHRKIVQYNEIGHNNNDDDGTAAETSSIEIVHSDTLIEEAFVLINILISQKNQQEQTDSKEEEDDEEWMRGYSSECLSVINGEDKKQNNRGENNSQKYIDTGMKKYAIQCTNLYRENGNIGSMGFDNEKSRQYAFNCANTLFDNEKYSEAGYIYLILYKFGVQEAIEYVFECTKELTQKNKCYKIDSIYQMIKDINNREDVETELNNINQKMIETNNEIAGHIYREISNQNNKQLNTAIFQGVKSLIRNKQPHVAKNVYRGLENMENGWLEDKFECANMLAKRGQLYEAGYMYIELLESGQEKAREKASNCAKALLEIKDHVGAGRIYKELIRLGTNNISRLAYNCAETLYNIQKYDEAGAIYFTLAESGVDEAVEYAFQCANMLFDEKEYAEAAHIYGKLVKIGNAEAIDYLIECIEHLSLLKLNTRKGGKTWYSSGRWLTECDMHIENIYKQLADLNDQQADEYVLQWIDGLIEKNMENIGVDIYKSLFKKDHSRKIEYGFKLASSLIESNKFYEARSIYEELGNLNNKQADKYLLQLANRRIEEKRYNEAAIIYKHLAYPRDKQSIQQVFYCVDALLTDKRYLDAEGLIETFFQERGKVVLTDQNTNLERL